jgi:hypothetical protein
MIWKVYDEAIADGVADPVVVVADPADPRGREILELHPSSILSQLNAKTLQPDGTLKPIPKAELIPGVTQVGAWTLDMLLNAFKHLQMPPVRIAEYEKQMRNRPAKMQFWMLAFVSGHLPHLAPMEKQMRP